MSFQPSVWRERIPPGVYIEGLDLVLGRFCAFSFVSHVDVHQFDRRILNPERTLP